MKFSSRISILLIFFFLLFVPTNLLANSPYQTLENTLERGERPDTELIDSLPTPASPHQYWLAGRTATDLSKANQYFREALENGTREQTVKFFKDWLRLALLREPEQIEFQGVRTFFKSGEWPRSMDDEAWFLAGQLGMYLDRPKLAERYFNNVGETSEFHGRALLFRAQLALEQDRQDRVESILSRYFLSTETSHRPLYWITRGKYFEDSGADSEAYIAYSHVINHYPRSLHRFEAEERIAELPLPKALYSTPPDEAASSGKTVSAESSGTNQPSDHFKIQVGAFRDRSRATQLRQSLVSWLKYPVKIRRATVDSRPYYRVRIETLPDRDTAVDVLTKLENSGYESYVVSPSEQR